MEFIASVSRLGTGSSFVRAKDAMFSMLTSAITFTRVLYKEQCEMYLYLFERRLLKPGQRRIPF